ncbi:hypothetical protein SteCoe_575 [Stentor coeruleus]|uniref:RAP domain-containing protein n=1 Tax=Stentor coeruleus TaxID=5963 RepID=A0A1R2D3R8_9CILI|nr:hypothetical protein SteCoe_575 [Stentor coeruleus]
MFKRVLRAFHEPEWKKIFSGLDNREDITLVRGLKDVEDNYSFTVYLKYFKNLSYLTDREILKTASYLYLANDFRYQQSEFSAHNFFLHMKQKVSSENFDWTCENITNFFHFIINNSLSSSLFIPKAETLTEICEKNLDNMTLYEIALYRNLIIKLKKVPTDKCNLKFIEKFEQTKYFCFFNFESLSVIHKALIPYTNNINNSSFPSNVQELYNETLKRIYGNQFVSKSFNNFLMYLSNNDLPNEVTDHFSDICDKTLIELYDDPLKSSKFFSVIKSKYSNSKIFKLTDHIIFRSKAKKLFITHSVNRYISEITQIQFPSKIDSSHSNLLSVIILKQLASEYIFHEVLIFECLQALKLSYKLKNNIKLNDISSFAYNCAKINCIKVLNSKNKEKIAMELSQIIYKNTQAQDIKDYDSNNNSNDNSNAVNYSILKYVWSLAVFDLHEPSIIQIFTNSIIDKCFNESKINDTKMFYIGQIHFWLSLQYPNGPQFNEKILEIILKCKKLNYPLRYDSGLREIVYNQLINPEKYKTNYFEYPHYIEFADIEKKVAIIIEDPSEMVTDGINNYRNGMNELKYWILMKKGWNVSVVTLESLIEGKHSNILKSV